MENKERILSQAGWLTNIQTIYIPPKTKEEIERLRLEYNEYIYKMCKVEITFLQEKDFTTKTILSENDVVDDETKLTVGDLTEDGFRFYLSGIREWIKKLDRSVNRKEIVTDTSFLEKKYKEYINYEAPFLKKLLLETKSDAKIFESKKKLTPIIEKIISELDGDMKIFYTKKSIKTTIELMRIWGCLSLRKA